MLRWWSKLIYYIWHCFVAFKPLTLPCSMPHPATSMPSSLRKGSRTAKKTRRHGHPSHAVPIVGACNDDDVVVACDVCTSCSHWLQPLCDWDDWVAGRMNTYNYFKSNYNITIITHTHIYIYIHFVAGTSWDLWHFLRLLSWGWRLWKGTHDIP